MIGKRWCILVLVFLLAGWPFEVQADSEDDVVLRAMKDELPRAMRLKLRSVEAPYYVGYRVTDADTLSIEASLGSVIASDQDRSRWLNISLRVGDPSFDNTNFSERSYMSRVRPERLPVEDDYDALRWEIWLASDDAYKEAAEKLEKKRAALAGKRKSSDVADFSKETPKSILGDLPENALDRAEWKSRAKRISAVFANRPEIHESSVTISVVTTTQRFASTEGTLSRDRRTVARIDIVAKTKASDGMSIKHFASFSAAKASDLPPEIELLKVAKKVADELTEIRDAPIVEGYMGPILFEGRAAAQIVQSSLSGHLLGTPPPKSGRDSYSRMRGDTELGDKVGRRVLATDLRIADDPRIGTAAGLPLVGGFAFDAEGVPAQPVALIDGGKLVTLLMSRTPRKDLDKSNGHARGGNYSPIRAQIANLIVSAHRGQSKKQLEGTLLKEAAKEGYDYALVVALLDNPSVTGMDREDRMAMMMAARGGDALSPPPLVMYKIRKGGKRKLVRGGLLGSIRLRAWRDVIPGKNAAVHSFSVSTEDGPFGMMGGRGGDPASIVAPELLFPEVEVKAASSDGHSSHVIPSPLKAE